MNISVIFVSTCVLISVVISASVPSKSTRLLEHRKDPTLPTNSSWVVPEARTCGGESEFVELRMNSCNGIDSPCRIKTSTFPQFELEYIPSANFDQWGYKHLVFLDGELHYRITGFEYNSSILKGVREIFKDASKSASVAYLGKNVTHQLQVITVADGDDVLEVCAEGDFLYV